MQRDQEAMRFTKLERCKECKVGQSTIRTHYSLPCEQVSSGHSHVLRGTDPATTNSKDDWMASLFVSDSVFSWSDRKSSTRNQQTAQKLENDKSTNKQRMWSNARLIQHVMPPPQAYLNDSSGAQANSANLPWIATKRGVVLCSLVVFAHVSASRRSLWCMSGKTKDNHGVWTTKGAKNTCHAITHADWLYIHQSNPN